MGWNPDEDYRAKYRLYDRRAEIERRLVATEDGRAFLAGSIDDIDEVVRLRAATALLPHGIPDAWCELERLRAAGSAKTALSASIISTSTTTECRKAFCALPFPSPRGRACSRSNSVPSY
jgi:hypothetical protein